MTESVDADALRAWIGDHIWDEDDFGGFTEGAIPKPGTGRTREQQVTVNVKELLDLAVPDWRDWTHGAQQRLASEEL